MSCGIAELWNRGQTEFMKGPLRFIYPNQNQIKFKELLEENKIVSIHQSNLRTVATEIYKAKKRSRLRL